LDLPTGVGHVVVWEKAYPVAGNMESGLGLPWGVVVFLCKPP
jgi:hypothetical protein